MRLTKVYIRPYTQSCDATCDTKHGLSAIRNGFIFHRHHNEIRHAGNRVYFTQPGKRAALSYSE